MTLEFTIETKAMNSENSPNICVATSKSREKYVFFLLYFNKNI